MSARRDSTDGVHATALVARDVRLGRGVRIGAYAIIEPGVQIGDECSVAAHAVIRSGVRMGRGNRIDAHAVIGGEPQDLSFDPALGTHVEIGDDNVFREGVTVHRSSVAGQATRIGNGCYLMNLSHVAHDCDIGDRAVIASYVALGGHVEIGARAFIGGGCMVHQFCRIGELAMVRGMSGVGKDVLPFSMAGGDPLRHYRLNLVGLRRAGIDGAALRALSQAFRTLHRQRKLDAGEAATPELERLRAWLMRPSRRGLHGFVRSPGGSDGKPDTG